MSDLEQHTRLMTLSLRNLHQRLDGMTDFVQLKDNNDYELIAELDLLSKIAWDQFMARLCE